MRECWGVIGKQDVQRPTDYSQRKIRRRGEKEGRKNTCANRKNGLDSVGVVVEKLLGLLDFGVGGAVHVGDDFHRLVLSKSEHAEARGLEEKHQRQRNAPAKKKNDAVGLFRICASLKIRAI